ncbi:MAG TPA: hypothetical protein VMX57_02950 [Planctomycetota bacterium]|nr:hypothetical protein [Planctomycetota bacterium]
MKFEDITTRVLKRAMDIYLKVAYAKKPLPLTVKNRVTFLTEHAGDDLADVLSHELIERVGSEADEDVVESYAVRLGNEQYPHMKLALRRRGNGNYGLMIESHDQHFELESSDPDTPRAQALKDFNRRVKTEIESRWRDAELPVFDEVSKTRDA